MDCEVHAVDNECVEEGAAAVCEVMLLDVPSTRVRVIRRCTTKKMHEENKQNCNPQENIMCPQRTICTKSGCRAPLPEGMHVWSYMFLFCRYVIIHFHGVRLLKGLCHG